MFHGIPGFYLTRGAVILSTHLVARKCKVFTTTSSREIQLCTQPANHLTLSPLLTANHVCQSIAHVQRFKWKGSVHKNLWKLMWKIYLCSVMTQHPLLCSSQADLPPFLAYTCLLQIYHLPVIQLRKAGALCPALDPDLLSQAHCCLKKKSKKKSVNTFVVLFLFYWVYVLLQKILLSLIEGSFVLYVVEVEVLLYIHRNCRLIRDGSPGQPPQLSHSSWALYIYICGFILF